MFGTIKWMIGITAVIVIGAIAYAVTHDRTANLLIVGAGVASTLTGIAWLIETRLGATWDAAVRSRDLELFHELLAERQTRRD